MATENKNTNNNCIRMRNLPSDFDARQLCQLFSQYGPIQDITLNKEREQDGSLISRGFGFITFKSPESARKAFDLKSHYLKGIKIDWGNQQESNKQLKWAWPMPESSVISITPIVSFRSQQNYIKIEIVPSSSEKVLVGNAEARERQLRRVEAQTVTTNFSIFVTGLSQETAKTDVLHSHFSKCGPISCIVKNEPSLGVAKITFGDKRTAATAILDFDGTEWMGYELSCKWWTKSQNRIVNKKVKLEVKTEANASHQSTSTEKENHRGLWLPKTRQWIASPPPPLDAGNESEATSSNAEQSRTANLSEFLRAHPDMPMNERIKLIRELLTSADI